MEHSKRRSNYSSNEFSSNHDNIIITNNHNVSQNVHELLDSSPLSSSPLIMNHHHHHNHHNHNNYLNLARMANNSHHSSPVNKKIASGVPSPDSSLSQNTNDNNNHSNTNTNSTNVSKTGKILKTSEIVGNGSSNNNSLLHHAHQTQYSSIYDNNCSTNNLNNNSHVNIIELSSSSNSSSSEDEEFLPICDALFNVISLAIYFCDIVFDILSAYSYWVNDGLVSWTIACSTFIFSSIIACQVLSYKLYSVNVKKRGQPLPCSSSLLLCTHLVGCGVLWRYFKLFIPLDMKLVKHKVRDLILLRLVHGFLQSAPMLLIQLYLILTQPSWANVSDLNIVSTSLSLLSLCWALASFSKNIRSSNVHKLMLTWLGLIFQFGWRLGTISCRILALTLYATTYHYWILLVISLHWLSMFSWIISPTFHLNFQDGKFSKIKKYVYAALLGIVYTFCYINILDSNSKIKMVIYYITMFLENVLLVSVWYIALKLDEPNNTSRDIVLPWFNEYKMIATTIGSFWIGICFMYLYYQYFHITKLSYGPNNNNNFETSGGGGGNSSSKIRRVHSHSGNNSSIGECSKSSSLMNGNFESSPSLTTTKEKCSFENNSSPLGNNCHIITNNNNNNKDSKYEFGSSSVTVTNNANSNNGNNSTFHGGLLQSQSQQQQKSKRHCNNNVNMTVGGKKFNTSNANNAHLSVNNNSNNPNTNIQGVFNCRFNPAMKRKKKKPTSFVPPPNLSQTHNHTNSNNNESSSHNFSTSTPNNNNSSQNLITSPNVRKSKIIQQTNQADNQNSQINNSPGNNNSTSNKMSHPFWKRPINTLELLENNTVASSSNSNTPFDIQQKLYEKKQQQLADLREIEEEIKQHSSDHGIMLHNSNSNSNSHSHGHFSPHVHNHNSNSPITHNYTNSLIPPPPYEKKRPWFSASTSNNTSPAPLVLNNETNHHIRRVNDELVLDPQHYLSPLYDDHEYDRHHEQGDDCNNITYGEGDNGLQSDWSYDVYALHDDLYHQLQYQDETQEVDEEVEKQEHDNYDHDMLKFEDDDQEILKPEPIRGIRRKLRKKSAGLLPPACPSSSQSVIDLVSHAAAVSSSTTNKGRESEVVSGRERKSRGNKDCEGNNNNIQHLHYHHHHNPTINAPRQNFYKSCRRIPSDVESQLSLSRSYTLPREFKYRRKFQQKLMIKNEQILPSTNSSDGDVDSGEDDVEIYGHLQKIPLPVPSVHHLHIPNHTPGNNHISTIYSSSSSSPRKQQQQTPGGTGSSHQPVHETKL